MDVVQFLLVLELCFIISFLFPAVSAFSGPVTYTSTVPFPGVPLREGIRRIHTLEHLENLPSPGGSQRYFEILSVSQPCRYGDHVTTSVECRVKGIPQTLYILGRPRDRQSSTVMCVRDGTQCVVVDLRVSPLVYQDGHSLMTRCTFLRCVRACDRDMEPVMRYLRFFRERPPLPPERANLQWYRRLVLGLAPLATALED